MKPAIFFIVTLCVVLACKEDTQYEGVVEASKDKDAESARQDDEFAPSGRPQQVTGAFLSIAFMEERAVVERQIWDNHEGNIEIAVCWRMRDSKTCLNEDALKVNYSLVVRDEDNSYRNIDLQPIRPTKPIAFNWILEIPIQYLQGTVLSKVATRESLARDLTNISEFNAKTSRPDGATSIGAADFVNLETLSKFPSTSGVDTDTPFPKPTQPKSPFWQDVLDKLKKIFGPTYSEPVSDITLEPIILCSDTCNDGMPFEKDTGQTESTDLTERQSDEEAYEDPMESASGDPMTPTPKESSPKGKGN